MIGTKIYSIECISFLNYLNSIFSDRIRDLLNKRKLPKEYKIITVPGDWKCYPPPVESSIRHVEITGPASDRKLVINALNSGANVFMADFEDSMSPTWVNVVQGQLNMIDAMNGTIDFISGNKEYKLNSNHALLMVRPRGLHMVERNFFNIPACLFDFGIFAYHNLSPKRFGYFYLPKLESAEEATLWNDIFSCAEKYLKLPENNIKCTVLIETLPAAFQMDPIIFALKDRILGLNCGRWDYIFSIIKNVPSFVMPDRSELTMERGFLDSYSKLLVQTCHKRGIAAIGGMSAYIPVKNDPVKNEAAMAKVREDKLREKRNGHDGTWVAHPGLVQLAKEIMSGDEPVQELPEITEKDLLSFFLYTMSPTEKGLENNIDVCLRYLTAWLSGSGCAPIHNLMEDMATAEISRVQLYQWIQNNIFSKEHVLDLISKKVQELKNENLDSMAAENLLKKLLDDCADFIITKTDLK